MTGSGMSSATTNERLVPVPYGDGSRRAIAATAFFFACGTWFAARNVSDWERSAPLVASYGILLVNTFFSIRCFGSLRGCSEPRQRAVDVGLVGLYAGLAASFGDEQRFVAVATLLFAVATLKYALLLGRGPVRLLARKLTLDAIGTIACVWTLLVILAGYPTEASWGLAIVNAAVNLYVLCIRPLYRQTDDSSRSSSGLFSHRLPHNDPRQA
jgi:hypothetical protein